MKTNWDYTKLANAYSKRPNYSEKAINKMLRITKLQKDDKICDIGAGNGHLTLMLAVKDYHITAIEPNDALRNIGIQKTKTYPNVRWFEGTGENTNQKRGRFMLVTFGSSFNVTNRKLALKEAARILKKEGSFACMWNYRNLKDPIQAKIEKIIKRNIKDYSYGFRREEQSSIILESGLFNNIKIIQEDIIHKQYVKDSVEAWKSHGTLYRQAGKKFSKIINEISNYLMSLNREFIEIPYTTKIWVAQKIG